MMARRKEPDQLSKDSTAALRANMSYGKWKALQYEAMGRPVIAPKEPEGPEPNTVCKFCGKRFYNPFKHYKCFCDDVCRMRYKKTKEREQREQGENLRNE
jgi:hypothetical protein